ncbi:phage/plasmid primase, P4 family [Natrinema sp. 1APR25-10V2]|uniref:DNA primase family protein n=1 Tax=Natrinema sp. 1APR25-10V2 TaxID=2951081 RepID=UPI00287471F1|nr:phage/plasmid primase, P4 family [Natrinema sp. 1APR25-10V2]MDS0473772.1 phage/plasmid primase, P4 family [Natrinema sp. 1APR25-10V2]
MTVLVDSASEVDAASIADADPDENELPARWEDMSTDERIDVVGRVWSWGDVRDLYKDGRRGKARQIAAYLVLAHNDWMYLPQFEELWWYNSETGVYEPEDPDNEDDEGDELGEILENKLDEHWAPAEKNHIKKRIQTIEATASAAVDAGYHDEPLLNVGNGVLNLETGDLEDHDPEYNFITGIDTDWTPDAEPGRIDEFLDESTQREEDRLFLEEVVGHTLLPRYQPKLSLVMHGPPDTGKGVFEDVIAELLSGNTSHQPLEKLTSNRFALADLVGSMANIGSDLSGNRINDLSLFKKLTGDDVVPAEKKGIDPQDFRNRATLIFSSNDPPTLGQKGEAVAERLYHVPFRNQHSDEDPDLPNKDRDLKSKLTTDEELERLLKLAVDGAQRLLDGGETSIPESKEERLEEYENLSDPEARVAALITTEDATSEDVIIKKHAHKAYLAIAEEMSTSKRRGKRDFASDMTKDYLSVETGRSKRHHDEDRTLPCWKGVRWVEGAERYLPNTVAERYGLDAGGSDDEEEEGDSISSDEEEDGGLVELDALEAGMKDVDIAAPIMGVANGPPWGKVEVEGRIDDEGSGVKFETRFCAVGLEAGETYILRNVDVEDDDGIIVVITPGTEVGKIDTDGEQSSLDTDGDDEDDDLDSGAGGDSDTSEDESIDDVERAKEAVLEILEDSKRSAASRSYLRRTVLEGSSLTGTHLEDALDELDAADRIDDQGADIELVGSDGDNEENGTPQAERLPELVRTIDDIADEESGAPHDAVVEEATDDAETVEADIETLKQKGAVYEPDRGKYRAAKRPQEMGR